MTDPFMILFTSFQKKEWVGTGRPEPSNLEYVEAMGIAALSGRNDKDGGR